MRRLCASVAVALAAVLAASAKAPDLAGLSFDPIAALEGIPLAIEGMAIAARAAAREARHDAELAARGVAEEPMSRSAVRYSIDTRGLGKLLFDDWGELYIDRRFVTEKELAAVRRIEAFVWEHAIAPLQAAGAIPAAPKRWQGSPSASKPPTPPMPPSQPAAKHGGRTPVRASPAPPAVAAGRAKPRGTASPAGLPVFRGFEDPRYQKHDATIARLVAAFNANKAAWCGGTPAQAASIPDLPPALVKSQMIEESGGRGKASLAAWEVDPLQANVPGDWGPEKTLVGLTKPSKRNEGTAEGNIKAAIMYLSRKGFSTAARPAAERPKARFDGWHRAVQRYNGRRDRTGTDRIYSEEYADKIARRAADPDLFVPIEVKIAKK